MPRPKGAGKTDPRFGRISSRLIDDIAREYDSGQKQRLFNRIRRLQRLAFKKAIADGGLESYGPDGPIGPPPCVVAGQVANQLAMSEEAISRIRAKDQETDAKATALAKLLYGDEVEEHKPMKFVVEITDPTRPKSEDIE